MIVVIDGNIGSGKSTQVQKLGDDSSFSVHREPLGAWGKLLEWFYKDPARWALTFQFRVIHCFNQILSDPSRKIVSERYPESTRRVFWKVLCDDGLITPEEQAVYDDYYHTFKPDLVIYLSTPPEQCWDRLQTRHQEGDGSITREYITKLDRLYDDMYRDDPCVHSVDGTMDPNVIHRCIKDIIHNHTCK